MFLGAILNANLPLILNGWTLCVRQPVSVALARCRQCAVERFLRVSTIGLRRFVFCPTTTIDTIVESDGKRWLERMRWGLVPSWWSKPLKELKLATFNARAETVATKPFFRGPFKRNRCLIPLSGYFEWQDTPSGKQP